MLFAPSASRPGPAGGRPRWSTWRIALLAGLAGFALGFVVVAKLAS